MNIELIAYGQGLSSPECARTIDERMTVISREVAKLHAESRQLLAAMQTLGARAQDLNALRMEPQCHLPGCTCNGGGQ